MNTELGEQLVADLRRRIKVEAKARSRLEDKIAQLEKNIVELKSFQYKRGKSQRYCEWI